MFIKGRASFESLNGGLNESVQKFKGNQKEKFQQS